MIYNDSQQKLIRCCNINDIEGIKKLLKSEKEQISINYNNFETLFSVIRNNQREILEIFFDNFEEDFGIVLQTCLNLACEKGHFEIVKFLTTSEKLTKWPDPYFIDSNALDFAATYKHNNLVEFLIFSPDLKNTSGKLVANFNFQRIFEKACTKDNVALVELFLQSKELKDSCDMHSNQDRLFEIIANNQAINVLTLLINHYKLEKTPRIRQTIEEGKNDHFKSKLYNKLESLFSLSELNSRLNTLPQTKLQQSTNKTKL